jgi:hypothetical protein
MAMSEESAVSSVAVTTTAKGEAQISVKAYALPRLPGAPVQPDANINDPDQLRAALKELSNRQTDYLDRMNNANESARDELPAVAARLYLETAAKLESKGVTVAGDPDRELLLRWNEEQSRLVAKDVA